MTADASAVLRRLALEALPGGLPVVIESPALRLELEHQEGSSAMFSGQQAWVVLTPECLAYAIDGVSEGMVILPGWITDVLLRKQGIVEIRCQPRGNPPIVVFLRPEREEVSFGLQLMASRNEGPPVLYGILRLRDRLGTRLAVWRDCPVCTGPLSHGMKSAECLRCRRFWSDEGAWLWLLQWNPAGSHWANGAYPDDASPEDREREHAVRPWRLVPPAEKPGLAPDRMLERLTLAQVSPDTTRRMSTTSVPPPPKRKY